MIVILSGDLFVVNVYFLVDSLFVFSIRCLILDSHLKMNGDYMEKGFSLFELLVVIAIIAILSVITLPHFVAWRNNAIIRATVFNIKSDLERAKSFALNHNTDVKVVFSVRGYSVYWKAVNSEGSDVWENEFSRSFDQILFDLDHTFSGERDCAVFNSRGMLRGAGGEIIMKFASIKGLVLVERTGKINIS